MTLTKEALMTHGQIRFNDYYRTDSQLLDTPAKVRAALNEQLTFSDDFSAVEIGSFFELWLGEHRFLFNDLPAMRHVLAITDLPTLMARYSRPPQANDHPIAFPAQQLLDHLPADYQLEKLQITGFQNEPYDWLGPQTLTDLQTYFDLADPTPQQMADFMYNHPVLIDSPADGFRQQIFYQLRERRTNTVVTPGLRQTELPLAVYALSQPHHQLPHSPQRSRWTFDGFTGVRLPIDHPNQFATALARDPDGVDFNHQTPLDGRPPAVLTETYVFDELLPGDDEDPANHLLWLDPAGCQQHTPTGLTPYEFTHLNHENLIQLITTAQADGLTIGQYQRFHRDTWEAPVTAGLTDRHFEHFIEGYHSSQWPTGTCYEIFDAQTGQLLVGQLGLADLSNYLLARAWA